MTSRLALSAAALLLGGCIASTEAMQPLDRPLDLQPTPERATVVFIRPSIGARETIITIVDEAGRYLGDSSANGCFAARVLPGEHTFIGFADNLGIIDASLEAGLTYFVQIAVPVGALSPRVRLFPIKKESPDMRAVDEWLAECHPFAIDAAKGQARLDADPDLNLEQKLRDAKEALRRYSQDELDARTLERHDGRVERPLFPTPE